MTHVNHAAHNVPLFLFIPPCRRHPAAASVSISLHAVVPNTSLSRFLLSSPRHLDRNLLQLSSLPQTQSGTADASIRLCLYLFFPSPAPNSPTTCPSPPLLRSTYLYVTSPSSPTGPRAWMRPVLIPTSVPNPYRKPSAKRVDAFTNVPAESTPRQNVRAAVSFSVTMLSVWCEECALMCAIAAASEGTVSTESVRLRCSVVYASGGAGDTCVMRFAGAGERDCKAAREGASQRSLTSAARRALATSGQIVWRTLSCRMSVSAALHAAG